ncbi:hypothetical protein D9M70_617790 [compost metagenome]
MRLRSLRRSRSLCATIARLRPAVWNMGRSVPQRWLEEGPNTELQNPKFNSAIIWLWVAALPSLTRVWWALVTQSCWYVWVSTLLLCIQP